MNYYTGIGSRSTPEDILKIMTKIATYFSRHNDLWTLRSGGAKGADKAFEDGADLKDIYYAKDAQGDKDAARIAEEHHPAWNRCSPYAKMLHTRNVYQILGKELDKPSKFVVCWTPDGCTSSIGRSIKTGGTGTAISIAHSFNVPVYNLKLKEHLNEFLLIIS